MPINIKPMPDKVIVSDIESGETVINNIIIRNDDGKVHGVRPRWAKVYSVGSEVTDLKEGDWVLMKHGRWSRKMDISKEDENPFYVWQADYPDGILMVSDSKPEGYEAIYNED